MLVSVIVPALNEEKFIERCLKSVLEQDFPKKDFELILVDSSSDDDTVKIGKKLADKVIVCERKGAAFGRNEGAKIAKGKFLLFLDADSIASKEWIKSAAEALEESVGVTGPTLPLEKKTDFNTWLGFQIWDFFADFSCRIRRPLFVGANFGIRRNIFEKEKGFLSNGQTGEDFELSLRLPKHGKISFRKKMLVYTSIRRLKEHGTMAYAMHGVGYLLFRKGMDWNAYRNDYKKQN